MTAMQRPVLVAVVLAALTVLAPVLSGSCAQGATAEQEFLASQAAGRPFVLVVAPRRPNKGSEAYADWQSYLEAFSTRVGSEVPIYTLSADHFRKIVKTPRLRSSFATLFSNGAQVLFHDGMVLEPHVYSVGLQFIRDRSIAAAAADHGLKSTKLERR